MMMMVVAVVMVMVMWLKENFLQLIGYTLSVISVVDADGDGGDDGDGGAYGGYDDQMNRYEMKLIINNHWSIKTIELNIITFSLNSSNLSA